MAKPTGHARIASTCWKNRTAIPPRPGTMNSATMNGVRKYSSHRSTYCRISIGTVISVPT
jgi:hypothetical protein